MAGETISSFERCVNGDFSPLAGMESVRQKQDWQHLLGNASVYRDIYIDCDKAYPSSEGRDPIAALNTRLMAHVRSTPYFTSEEMAAHKETMARQLVGRTRGPIEDNLFKFLLFFGGVALGVGALLLLGNVGIRHAHKVGRIGMTGIPVYQNYATGARGYAGVTAVIAGAGALLGVLSSMGKSASDNSDRNAEVKDLLTPPPGS
jgi:hypothetical protein